MQRERVQWTAARLLPAISSLKAIDVFSSLCKEQKIFDVLRSDNAKDYLGEFNENQVEEEITKASAPEYCYEQMIKLENGRFFGGRIGILFWLLPKDEQKGFDTMSQENIRAYSAILLELFDGSDKGVSDKFDDNRFLLRRALMSFSPYYFGRWRSGCWSFNYGINEWRDYINGKNDEAKTFKSLLKELLVPAFKEGKDLYITLSEHVEAISKNFESDILVNDNSFRYHFIRYPDIWEYMSTKRCSRNGNNFDIVLKKSNSNNSNRMELRTMSLYLDYKNNKDYIPDWDGWKLDIWPKEKSCFYFERKTLIGDDRRTIAIDVYFYDDNGRRTSEDCYSFDLFIRPLHRNAENEEEKLAFADEDYRQNKDFFLKIITDDQMSLFVRKDDGRLHSNKPYSRHELKQVLKNILGGINNALKAAEENADAPVV